MNYTEKLSHYIAELKFEDLPKHTVEQIKKLTMHTVAAALAAHDMPQTQKCVDLVEEKGGYPQATVWGNRGLKTTMEDAVYVNGTCADLLDWEDCSWTGHPSAGAISVAFAVAECKHRTGKEYIEAVAAAYDVYQRIAMSVQPSPDEWGNGKGWKGWGLTCWQIFASSVPAAKLLKLDEKKIVASFGSTGFQMNVLGPKREQSDIYHFAHGFCAKNGLNSALVAEKGIDDWYSYSALDGDFGLWRQMSDKVDWDWYDKKLGEWYLVDETLYKHWPTNVWIQAPLDALDAIYQERAFSHDEIAKIRVSPIVPLYAGKVSYPMTLIQAEFNLAYCFSAYLAQQTPSAKWFSVDKLNGGVLPDISDKIEFFGETKNPLQQFEYFWKGSFPETTVEVLLTDGTKLEKTLRYPKGHPKNPYKWEEEVSHFRNAVACLEPEKVDKFLDFMQNLEQVEDFAEVVECLMVNK